MQTHPASEAVNPLVYMQAMTVSAKLDDPGIGLRDNGRKVLCYADLKSLFADPDGRAPGREIELHLTGHMARFAWSFNGRQFMDDEPLRINYGERNRYDRKSGGDGQGGSVWIDTGGGRHSKQKNTRKKNTINH